MKLWTGLCVALMTIPACAAGDSDGKPEQSSPEQVEAACVPGHQTICACPNDGEGVQVCKDDGSGLAACECDDVIDVPDPSVPCGDGTCSADENCHTCVQDCGTCLPCDIAPSCDNAAVPGASLPHWGDFDIPKMEQLDAAAMQQRLTDKIADAGDEIRVLAAALDDTPALEEHLFVTALREVFAEHPVAADALRQELSDAGMGSPAAFRELHPEKRYDGEVYDTVDVQPGGTLECGAPLLRLAVSKIKVHEEDDDFANDIVYCVVQAESMTGAEIRVTPQTPNLDEGDEYTFSLETGVFWGQQGPTTPGSNMLITYDCIEADTTGGYQDLVNAIGEAAGDIGNVVDGDNGWIFDAAAAIAPVVSTGLALNQDDHLFNAQQTIPLDRQLELTNGAFWTVRRDGTHILSDWDWELTVKAWGCAEYGEL